MAAEEHHEGTVRAGRLRASALRIALGALAIAAAVPYLPGALSRGAWNDDFVFLEWAQRSDPSLVDMQFTNGRPVTAALTWVQYTAAGGIDGLRWARLSGVIGVVALALYVTELLRRRAVSLPLASLTGLGVAFLPPMHMYAGWVPGSLFAWAALLALMGDTRWQAARTARSPMQAVAAAVMLAVAFLVYPPAAFVYWLGPAIDLALGGQGIRDDVRRMLSAAVHGAAALALVVPVVLVTNRVAGAELKQRASFVSTPAELAEKAVWLVSRPLVISARPFLVSSPGVLRLALVSVPVLGVITWWLYASRRGGSRERVAGTVLVLATLLFATGAHAVLDENVVDFRFFPGICAIVWVLLALSLCQAPSPDGRALLRRGDIAVQVLTFVVLVAGWSAWQNTTRLFTDPFRVKDEFLRERLAAFDPDRQRAVVVVEPDGAWPLRPAVGVYSIVSDLAYPWVAVPNVQLLLREQGIDPRTVRVEVRQPGDAPAAGERDGTALVVDLSPLRDRLDQ